MRRAFPSRWGWVRHSRCGTDTGLGWATRGTCQDPCSGTPLTSIPTTIPTRRTTTAGTTGGIPIATPTLGITSRTRAIRPGDSTSPWASASGSAGDTAMIRGGVGAGVGTDGRVGGRTAAGMIMGGTTTGGIARGTTTTGAPVSPTCIRAAPGMPPPDTGRHSISRGPATRNRPEGARRWRVPRDGPNPRVQLPPGPPRPPVGPRVE